MHQCARPGCEALFESANPQRLYCSDACRVKAGTALARERIRATTACCDCGGPISGRTSVKILRCQSCHLARVAAKARKPKQASTMPRHESDLHWDCVCVWCGSSFTAGRPNGLYCSPQHKNLAYAKSRREAGRLRKDVRSGATWQTCADCGKRVRDGAARCRPCGIRHRDRLQYAAEHGPRRRAAAQRKLDKAAIGTMGTGAWCQGRCRMCGDYFVRSFSPSSYCSKAHRVKDQRWAGDWITQRRRYALYRRDCWVCQICFEPVDRTLHHLDNWAASLDHIVPRSHGGDDSPENLRLAHRICNSIRGDRIDAA